MIKTLKLFLIASILFFPAWSWSTDPLLLAPLPIQDGDFSLSSRILEKVKENLKKSHWKVKMTKTPSNHHQKTGFLGESLEKARDEQFNFRDKKAISIIKEALNIFGQNPARLEDQAKLGEAHLLLAYCYKNTGQRRLMSQTLKEAARLNPNLNPSELLFPPSLIRLFEKAKDGVWNSGKFGQLTIQSAPSNARVYVNSSFKGKTPLRIDRLPVGTHHLLVTDRNKQAYKKLSLLEGQSSSVTVKLTKLRKKKTEGKQITLKDFRKQKKLLKNIQRKEKSPTPILGLGTVMKKNYIRIVVHPIGLPSKKPKILKFAPKDSVSKIAYKLYLSILK